MGQCVAVCNIIKKQDGDIKMDKLNKDSDVIADKYIVSPYFPKIISGNYYKKKTANSEN